MEEKLIIKLINEIDKIIDNNIDIIEDILYEERLKC